MAVCVPKGLKPQGARRGHITEAGPRRCLFLEVQSQSCWLQLTRCEPTVEATIVGGCGVEAAGGGGWRQAWDVE